MPSFRTFGMHRICPCDHPALAIAFHRQVMEKFKQNEGRRIIPFLIRQRNFSIISPGGVRLFAVLSHQWYRACTFKHPGSLPFSDLPLVRMSDSTASQAISTNLTNKGCATRSIGILVNLPAGKLTRQELFHFYRLFYPSFFHLRPHDVIPKIISSVFQNS